MTRSRHTPVGRHGVGALLLLFLALVLGATTAASSNTTSMLVSGNSSMPGNGTDNSTIAVSYCELCRDKGECELAYRGGPGVFCGGTTLRRAACCCADKDMCSRVRTRFSNTVCECVGKHTKQPKTPRIGIFSSNTIGWTVLAMFVLGALFAMYLYTTRLDRKYHYREPREVRRRQPSPPAYCPPRIAVPVTRVEAAATESAVK